MKDQIVPSGLLAGFAAPVLVAAATVGAVARGFAPTCGDGAAED
jgi:hypothetical protein